MKSSEALGRRSSSAGRKKKPSGLAGNMPKQLAHLLTILKKYQHTSLEHVLANPFGGILLDPGLGKTLVTLVAFWILRLLGYVDWLLVVAPLRPCSQVWPLEVKKWELPFSLTVLHGDDKNERIREKHDIYVINYEGLGWLRDNIGLLTARGTGWCVPDESTKIKNDQSLRSRLLWSMVDCFGRRTILTGTPIPKGYIDLFGQMKWVDKGKRLGFFITHYRRYFLAIDEQGTAWSLEPDPKTKAVRRPHKEQRLRYEPTPHGKREIERLVSDCFIWFSDSDLGLPPWRNHPIFIELPPKVRKLYDEFESDFLAAVDIEGERSILMNASNAGVLGMKLRQIANGGLYDEFKRPIFLHDEKARAVEEYFEELHGKSLFVAFEFAHDKARLQKVLQDAPAVDGSTSVKEGNRLMAAFNEGKEPLLLVQSTMMEGLNLQEACHNVIWHSLTWRADCYIQLIKRIHRLGQKHKVTVAQVIARNTRDERVLSVCRQRVITQEKFLKAIRSYQNG